jgi:anti-anti-sigma factor
MSGNLFFESRTVDSDILALILKGDLDSTTTEEFNQEVNKHLENGCSKIIIDCRHLGYLSSMGIGSLIALKTRLHRKGGTVKLSALQGPIAQLVSAVRLDKVLDIYPDLEFARQSFHT